MSELTSNELRIGNYVYGVSDRVEIVCSINDDELKTKTPHFDDHHTCEIKYFKPIPLTEEWLVKFGFHHREFSFDKESFYLMKRTGKSEYLYQSNTHRFQVKYVHQLQNLYFSNRKKELTVTNL